MAWGYEGLVGASADGVLTKTGVAERFIGGIGIPFVDGANRPVLSLRPAVAFEGWVDIMPDDSQFYISQSFETFPSSPELISGSDLTASVPLVCRLAYESGDDGKTNFYSYRDDSDSLVSFVMCDSVVRLTPDGNLISST